VKIILKCTLIGLCFSLCVLPEISAQDQARIDALDAYIRHGVTEWEAPGFAVAIVKDGKIELLSGYGVRELGNEAPVDEHTLFAIGSTTKAMTAAALGMLVDEEKLRWDDRVSDTLPGFRVADPFVSREITIRDLLTHRAGLPNADFLWYGQERSPEEILEKMRYVAQETSLRSAFTYQNIMYAAAGAVVAEVSGMAWEDFVRERIFVPLGMSRTIATAATLGAQDNVAMPHYRIDGVVHVIENASVDAVAPAGSVWSSVSDMARWMRFLLEGETEDGVELLSEETLEELFRPQTIVDADEFYPTQRFTKPHWMTYGLGWFQHDYEGRAVDFHTGSIDGMVALHGLVRDERVGVYVLGNLDHAELRHAILYRVLDVYGKGEGRDWSADLLAFYGELSAAAQERALALEDERKAGTSPSHALEAYEGSYSDRLYGAITVTQTDASTLRLNAGPGLSGEMTHWHHDVFRVSWDKRWRGTALVSFRLTTEGTVGSLEIGGASLNKASE